MIGGAITLLLLSGCGEAVAPTVQEPSTAPEPTSSTPPLPAESPPERIAVRHVLVSYSGATGAPLGTARTRAEARRRAEDVHAEIRGGTSLDEVARRMSDDPSKARGGFLGSGQAGSWVPEFEEVAFQLEVGQVSGVVESPFGFHIIQRDVLEEIRLRHLVVQYRGALIREATDELAERTPEQARKIAQLALDDLDEGQPFEEVALRFSDGPMGLRGGDLGWFLRGELGPQFDQAAFVLAVGEHSGVVQTPFGFHIVQRVE